MALSTDRFPSRFAGSAFQPFVVEVRNPDGTLRDLTAQTADMTIRKAKGVPAVMQAVPNTNVPGTAGLFAFQPTPAQVASPGEYVVTVVMQLIGLPEVGRFALTIDPAT